MSGIKKKQQSAISSVLTLGKPRYDDTGKKDDKYDEPKHKEKLENMMEYEHEDAMDELRTFALTQPMEYDKLRQLTKKSLRNEIALVIYDKYWDLLYDGRLTDGTDEYPLTLGDKEWSPRLPEQEIKRYSLAAADAVASITSKILDEVMPPSFSKIVDNAYGLAGKASVNSLAVDNIRGGRSRAASIAAGNDEQGLGV